MKFSIRTKKNVDISKNNLSDLISELHNFQQLLKDKYNISNEVNIKFEVKEK